MSEATLKLVEADANQGDILRFERRRANRHVIGGRVTALRKDVDPNSSTNRICSLQLLDISDEGIGVISQDPISTGSPISIFFPPHGAEGGFDLFGKVVRCQRLDHGHQIGVHFDVKVAA